MRVARIGDGDRRRRDRFLPALRRRQRSACIEPCTHLQQQNVPAKWRTQGQIRACRTFRGGQQRGDANVEDGRFPGASR